MRFTTEGPALDRYAVVLIVRREGRDHTVRVYDNAHGPHDLHRYTLDGEKQDAQTAHDGTAQEAFDHALHAVRTRYQEMIDGWER